MRSADVAEGSHANREQIRAGPEPVAVNKSRSGRILYGGIGAGDRVTDLFKFSERVIYPATLGFPIRHGRDQLSVGVNLFVDGFVISNLHLIDLPAFGRE